MPIFCEPLAAETLRALNQAVNDLPAEHHLRKDSDAGIVSIVYDAQKDVTVFHGKSGFYFRRGTVVDSIKSDINNGRGLICTAYELGNDPTLPNTVLAGFEEKFGVKNARKIDTYTTEFNNRKFLLAKFPANVIKQLFETQGGTLKTGFKGPRDNLLKIPTLDKYFEFKETEDPTVASVFATQYDKGNHDYVKTVHYQLLQEVISHPNLGITLSPVAEWTS
jgi:hypothetical protein